MFDKWKNIKIAGTIVILAAVVVFLFMNVRIKPAADYRAEKSTAITAENASEGVSESEAESIGENSGESKAESTDIKPTESEAVIAAEGGESENQGALETSAQQGGQTQSGGNTQSETEAEKTIQVSIEIRCDSAVKIKDSISNPGLKEKIPDSGEILKETVYSVSETKDDGSKFNVYDLLSKAAGENGILITANANKTYVMSINYLDQMMLGQQSGWKYSVNGKVPGMAASSYILQDGDKVKWFYVLSASEE